MPLSEGDQQEQSLRLLQDVDPLGLGPHRRAKAWLRSSPNGSAAKMGANGCRILTRRSATIWPGN